MDKDARIAALEDAVKDKDRRIADLRQEINEQNELITELREHIEADDDVTRRWIDTFGLAPGKEPGTLTIAPWIDEALALRKKYNDLIRRFNKLVDFVHARVLPQPMGRPLAASKDQRRRVLVLHKSGKSLRWIADEMNLGLQTVRTVVDKADRVDRTTTSHIERMQLDLRTEKDWRRQEKDMRSLPGRIAAHLESSADLLKQAKGLK
jgi:hypothetical protein